NYRISTHFEIRRRSLMLQLLIASVLLTATSAITVPEDLSEQPAILVSDEYFWWQDEGNLGAEITGKFQSLDDMAALLHLKQSVGKFKARQHPFEPTEWVLYDILVRIDLNANGTVATWRVSGP